MGATRPASGIKAKAHRQAYRLTDRHVISAVCEPLSVYEHCIYPDVMNRSYRTKFIKGYGWNNSLEGGDYMSYPFVLKSISV